MGVWAVLQIALNLLFLASIGICIIKLRGRREEDPRLSYGLKLLQNKIAVLEDLSDKTEVQVRQLVVLLENKMRDLQQRVQEADGQLSRMDQTLSKTMEVANIFQEKVPHEEIVERKVTNKYINAARLAHHGASMQEIQQRVDLPQAELDLIVKLNKEQLTFSEDHLPAWVDRHPIESNQKIFEPPHVDMESLQRLGDDFRKACKDFEEKTAARTPPEPEVVPYQFKKHNGYV